jgi:hypothetical protein
MHINFHPQYLAPFATAESVRENSANCKWSGYTCVSQNCRPCTGPFPERTVTAGMRMAISTSVLMHRPQKEHDRRTSVVLFRLKLVVGSSKLDYGLNQAV